MPVFISASQLQEAQMCRRKRYFSQVLKMPQLQKGYQAFGTVLHSVIERYLRADMLGYVNGRPVDLYPEGWDQLARVGRRQSPLSDAPKGSKVEASVTPQEQVLIKTLVQQAIDDGVIERKPGGLVEWGFEMPIRDGAVVLNGFIDYCYPAAVEDHKTSKNRRYLLSPKKLAVNTQMMFYAGIRETVARQRGEVPPDTWELIHNQFIKGENDDLGPGVRRTRVRVTAEAVHEFWRASIVPTMDLILEDAQLTDPMEIPDPEPGACAAYGGCPFLTVCSGQETIQHYKARIKKLNQQRAEKALCTEPQPQLQQKAPTMALADLLNKKQVAPAAKPQPIQQATTAAPVAAAPSAEQVEVPPWAHPGCGACGKSTHPGFNSRGAPCRICDIESKKAGRPTSDQFVIVAMEDGTRVWEPKAEEVVGQAGKQQAVTPAPTEQREAAKVQEAPAVEPEPEPTTEEPAQEGPQEPAEDPVEEEAAEPAPTVSEAEAPKRGRPKKGLTLLIGCLPLQGVPKGDLTTAEEVLSRLQVDGKAYWDCEVWARREALVKLAPALVGEMRGFLVQAIKSPDTDALMSAMLPHAQAAIRGIL